MHDKQLRHYYPADEGWANLSCLLGISFEVDVILGVVLQRGGISVEHVFGLPLVVEAFAVN